MSVASGEVAFAAIPKVELSDAVVERIRDAVLLGELEPGTELPSERELAVQLGVNRTTVREGLSRLAMLGLIDRHHGRRCRVLDYRRTGSLTLVPELARLGVGNVGRSVVEAIGILYEGTVALVVERLTDHGAEQLLAVTAALEAAVAAGGRPDIIDADREFHHTVAALAQSVTLELIVNSYYQAFDATLDAGGAIKHCLADLPMAIIERGRPLPHRRLADAIVARDGLRAREIARKMMANAPRGEGP